MPVTSGFFDEPMKVEPIAMSEHTLPGRAMGQSRQMHHLRALNHQLVTAQSDAPDGLQQEYDNQMVLQQVYYHYKQAEAQSQQFPSCNSPNKFSKSKTIHSINENPQSALQQVYYQYQQTQALSQQIQQLSSFKSAHDSDLFKASSPQSLSEVVGNLQNVVRGLAEQLEQVAGEMPVEATRPRTSYPAMLSSSPQSSDLMYKQKASRAAMQSTSPLGPPPGLENVSKDEASFELSRPSSFEEEMPMHSSLYPQDAAKEEKNTSAKKDKKGKKSKPVQRKELTTQPVTTLQVQHQEMTAKPITTLMIRNVPCALTQQDLVQLLDTSGFADKYDFLHLPVAAPMARHVSSNLGYGFINFTEAEFATEFQAKYEGTNMKCAKDSCSTKQCVMTSARIQGLAANLHNFRRAIFSNYHHKPYIKMNANSQKILDTLGWKTLKDAVPTQKSQNQDAYASNTTTASSSSEERPSSKDSGSDLEESN